MLRVGPRSPAVKHSKLEIFQDDIKTSPSQLYKDVEFLKLLLTGEGLSEIEYWKRRQELAQLLESLLLIDLDYALDKKVEQDLWSFVFRNPIAACQSKAKEQKSSTNAYSKSQLTTLLETASGFYLQLLQKLCCAYDIDLPCHPRDSVYGLTKEWISRCYPIVHKPHKSSLFYICQHCLVHLGDIARYRGQSLQAENFYRHAVDLVPSNGQPYNQLALLEAASGEKLSTVFFYIRSLAVRHPFPAAGTNLQTLFAKMSSDGTDIEGKTRMTAFEYVTVFLQFHAAIHLNTDLKKAENMQDQLNSSLPALIIAEKFETWQLVQMVAVCLFAIEHAWGVFDADKNRFDSGGDHSLISSDEKKASLLIEELLGNLLYAFLLPLHASFEPKETAAYYTLPAVKIIIDWFLQDPNILQHEPLIRKPQLWHAFCKLLNDLDVISTDTFDVNKFEDIPLPEDWDLQCFLPLKESQRHLKFNINSETPSDEESIWLRAFRLCKSGEVLTKKRGLNLLSVNHTNGRRYFKAVHHTEAISEQVLQHIQELAVSSSVSSQAVETSSNVLNVSVAADRSQPSNRSKSIHQEGNTQQEVRFKLDDIQQRKEKLEIGQDDRHTKEAAFFGAARRMGKNVAMQAIFQQQAAQNSANMTSSTRTSEYGKESLIAKDILIRQQPALPHVSTTHQVHSVPDGNCLASQVLKENFTREQISANRSQLHHLPSEQYSSLQTHHQQKPQAVELGNSVEREPHWLQSFNVHQNTVPNVNPMVRSNTVNNYMQGNVQHIIQQPQSASDFNFQSKSQAQTSRMIGKPVSAPQPAFLANPQNMMWSYMNFMASYQHSSHQVVMQPSNDHQPTNQLHSQASNYYVMNSGVHQKLQQSMDSSIPQTILPPYHSGPSNDTIGMTQQASGLLCDKTSDQQSPHQLSSNMWKSDGNPADVLQNQFSISQIVSRAVGQTLQNSPQSHIRESATVNSGSSHDLGSNTYSLFNSPWPSGLSVPRTAPKESQHHGNVEPVAIQPRVQSLWSGPGPSPLERLLEQQKQRRDSTSL